ncbi:MAG: arylsulfatase [Lentisphaeraceae bacterium]|nr:arylsulfatase [Lentisphaeraceae bacterium]
MKYFLLLFSMLLNLSLMAEETPNVVFIFADDLGYGDVGCYGATKIKTPSIDKLAAEGRRFTDAHSASAVCTPSRFALLTGEYPIRAFGGKGSWGPLSPISELIIPEETLTLPKVFKQKGYETACIGKWHLGFDKGGEAWKSMPVKKGPLSVGFDYYFGVPLVNSGSPYVYMENHTVVEWDPSDPLIYGSKTPSKTTTYPKEASVKSPNRFGGAKAAHALYDDEKIGTLLTEKSINFIEKNKEKPFFLYLATTNIHHPFTPAPRFKGTSECGLYGDFIHELDWMVGEIVSCLEKNKLRKKTLIVFTSDNGGMLNLAGRNAIKDGHKMNGDVLGFKFGVWEGGHRVPFITNWPGKIKAGTVSKQLICNVDMLASFASLTKQGTELTKGKDSVNVLPALLGETDDQLRKQLLISPKSQKHLSLRRGKWMYIPARGSGGFAGGKEKDNAWGGLAAITLAKSINSDIENGKYKKDAAPAQLYDLENDLNQTTNVYNQYPEVVKEMAKALKEYSSKIKKGTPKKRKKK